MLAGATAVNGACLDWVEAGMSAHHLVLGGSIDEFLTEVLPVLIGRSFLDNDLLIVVGQLEDDVLVLLGQLQIIVRRYAFLCDGGPVQGGLSVGLGSNTMIAIVRGPLSWRTPEACLR